MLLANREKNKDFQLKTRNRQLRTVMVTGISGMLGVELYKVLKDEYKIIGLDVRNFPLTEHFPLYNIDITNWAKFSALSSQPLVGNQIDLIIHTAAYTDVDGCEKNPDLAYKVNALGTRNLVLFAQEGNIPLMYISTDFVFNGKKRSPYLEFDEPCPLNIYGRSKLAGEKYVSSFLDRFFIVRTAWLYGRYGKNFVKTILKLAREKSELKVVDDQVGSPTYAKDLAQGIKELLCGAPYGIYHLTNSGICSWYDFARKILELAGINIKIKPITSGQLDRPAKRPSFSVLENFCLKETMGFSMRSWQKALKEYMQETGDKISLQS